jgi:hypothetical protein
MIGFRPVDPPGPDDGTEERIPLGGCFDRISVARIGADGDLRIRTVTPGPDGRTDETVGNTALRDRPAARRLRRARIEDGGRVFAFDDAEIAQLEAGVPKHLTVTEHFLPVILSAAESKYGGLPDGAWRLAAGSLGLSVEAARAMARAREDWWARYARRHDGQPQGWYE